MREKNIKYITKIKQKTKTKQKKNQEPVKQ